MILMSDRTHLSNFAAHKTDWPVYVTIGNLSSKICQTPSMHSVAMVALLPIPNKNSNNHQKWQDEKRQTHQEGLNDVLRRLHKSLTFQQNRGGESG